MERIYENLIAEHLEQHRQMAFLAGPRQVGKTTCAKDFNSAEEGFYYFNWDNKAHKQLIIAGSQAVADYMQLERASNKRRLIVFDEIHKYSKWKQFLKGFFDLYEQQVKIIVTGSAKLDIYKRGSDSLMGRYFLYRIHPLSVAELLTTKLPKVEIRKPKELSDGKLKQLLEFGGFPEPFLKASKQFQNLWQRLKLQQLIQEDIRSLSQIQELTQLEMLADLLKHQAGQLIHHSNLANAINVSVPTISRWLSSLEAFYYCFRIKPWFKNVKRSLKKDAKIYLWDWSNIEDAGARIENFVAAHLLKAVHFWTDYGFGHYELFFLRDKEKREVDFIVVKDKKPWFLVEVKNSGNHGINQSLYHYQKQTGAKHAFQVALDMPYIQKDCFSYTTPIIVPLKTFLSQLV